LAIFKLMKSRILLGLAGLSLLLAIGSLVLLVRSYTYYDAIYYSNLQRTHQLFTVPGSLVLSTWTHLPLDSFVWSGESGRLGEVKLRLYRDGFEQKFDAWDTPPSMTAGFWFQRGSYDQPATEKTAAHTRYDLHAAVPIWLITLLLLIAPALWGLKFWQRYRRAKMGHCIYCNTEMPTPDVCPGCGREYEEWVL
jgi:hypothetical protein